MPSFGAGETHGQNPPAAHALEDVLDRAGRQDPAFLDHRHEVADLGQLGQDVRAEEDGLAIGGQLANQRPEFDAGARIEVGGRLVENQQLRVVNDGAAECDALLEALRKSLDVSIPEVADAHELDDVLHGLLPCGAAQVVRAREEIEILGHRRIRVDTGVVGHEAGDPADLFRIVDHGIAADARVAALRRIQRRQNPHRRCLAGSVRSDEPEDLTSLDAERHVVYGTDAVEVPDEALELQHRLAHGRSSSEPSTR